MIPIAEHRTRRGEIVVVRNRCSVAYWQQERHQSHADLNGISMVGYIHAMHGLLRQAGARDVLMIGCGGGNLATMLRRDGVRVTIVEINAWSFRVARLYFAMPSDVECHVADGRGFLRRHARKYDAIVLDAYAGDEIPAQLRSHSFFELARSRLRRGGVLLVNAVMADDRDDHLERLTAQMRRTWRDVRGLDALGKRDRNAVAMAGAVRRLKPPRLRMRPKVGARGVMRELAALSFTDGLRTKRGS